jgi:hypothetical protein
MPDPTIQHDSNGNPILKKGAAPKDNHATQFQDNGTPYKTVESTKLIVEYYNSKTVVRDKQTGEVIPELSKELHTQYGSPQVQKFLKEMGDKVLYTRQNFKGFQVQSRGNSQNGTYTSSPQNQLDWDDFKARHKDWINQKYTGGVEAFIKDVQDKSKSGTATEWFQNRINEFSREKFGEDYFKKGSKGPDALDGKFGQVTFSVPRFFESAPQPDTPQRKPDPDLTQKKLEYEAAKKANGDGWWLQDVANMAATLTDPINRYEPSLQQVDMKAPEYSLMDPSRQIAAMQEQGARYGNLVENTAEGQVARATMLGAAGEQASQVAGALAGVEAQNVQISNNGAIQNAAAYNQEQQLNATAMDQYVQRMATLGQQYDNSKKTRKYQQLAAFVNGVTNNHRKKMMEQVLFPDTFVDPETGDTTIAPSGRDFMNPYDTYVNPGTPSSGQSPENYLLQQANMVNMARRIAANEGWDPKTTADFVAGAHNMGKPQTPADKSAQYKQLQANAMLGMYQGAQLPRVDED